MAFNVFDSVTYSTNNSFTGNTVTGNGNNQTGISIVRDVDLDFGEPPYLAIFNRIEGNTIDLNGANTIGMTINSANGPISLLGFDNNIVNTTPGNEFMTFEGGFVPDMVQGFIEGQIHVNDALVP